MREFLLFARKAWTKPFNINELPKAGRMDVVARCITNAFFISYSIRKDTNFFVSLNGPPNPPLLLKFIGNELKGIYYDERSVGGKINEALKKFYGSKKLRENDFKISEGFYISEDSFEKFLKFKSFNKKIVYLHEKGIDIRNFDFAGNEIFVLGDHKGLPKKAEKFLDKIKARKVSVGPRSYLASHCIVIVQNELDRRGL